MSIGPQSSCRSALPLTPTEHYAAVAEELVVEFDDDAPEWNACQMGRWRSAISRAYYSVFLAFKQRLIEARRGDFPKSFPRVDVHRKLRQAVGNVLGTGPGSLSSTLRELSEKRTDADYDWWLAKVLEADVTAHLRRAERICVQIRALPETKLREIAHELVRIDQADAATARAGRP